jgi:hypothetical protein
MHGEGKKSGNFVCSGVDCLLSHKIIVTYSSSNTDFLLSQLESLSFRDFEFANEFKYFMQREDTEQCDMSIILLVYTFGI